MHLNIFRFLRRRRRSSLSTSGLRIHPDGDGEPASYAREPLVKMLGETVEHEEFTSLFARLVVVGLAQVLLAPIKLACAAAE